VRGQERPGAEAEHAGRADEHGRDQDRLAAAGPA
jgi:hypothetical protein